MSEQKWKCRRCGKVVDMANFKCGCTASPSPWEPIDNTETLNQDKAQCSEPCLFCESHEHCSDAHPFRDIDELIDAIPIGVHIPCGILDKNYFSITRNIKQAFRTYTRKLHDEML